MPTSPSHRRPHLAPVVSVGCVCALLALVAATPAFAQQHHGGGSDRARERSAYRHAVHGWHDADSVEPATLGPDGRLVLRLWSVNTHARCEIAPPGPDGSFDPTALTEFGRVLSDPRTHESRDMDPQLLALVYNVAEHFHAPQLTVISGYRANSGHSNHARGRAMDFLIPGVSDADVAAYARTLGNVGVGIYPVSGFVHLDVRDTFYTWVDYSGPGSGSRHHRHHQHGHARGGHHAHHRHRASR